MAASFQSVKHEAQIIQSRDGSAHQRGLCLVKVNALRCRCDHEVIEFVERHSLVNLKLSQ